MKRTEGGPQVESKDFRYGVNGFPKARGLYRRGDNGAIQPDRFYRAWNVQFNGDEVTERGGQSETWDLTRGVVVGIHSSNISWGDTIDSSKADAGLPPGVVWGEYFDDTTATPTNVSITTDTEYTEESGFIPLSSTGYNAAYPEQFIQDGPIGQTKPSTYGSILDSPTGSFISSREGETYTLGSKPVHDTCRFGNYVVFSFKGGAGPEIYTTPVLGVTYATSNNAYSGAVLTDISDSGLTWADPTVTPLQVKTNSAAKLFVYNGDLYALYPRVDSASQGLLRKWVSGTTWSTAATFPALTVKDSGGGTYDSIIVAGFGDAYVEFNGNIYIAVKQKESTGSETYGNFNSISILRFNGTTLSEEYNFAAPVGKRTTIVAGLPTTNGMSNLLVTGTPFLPALWATPDRVFLTWNGHWYLNAGALIQTLFHAAIFTAASDGTLTYEGDTINTPSLIYVDGSTKPSLPIDSTTVGFATSYPDWNVAPWIEVVKVGNIYYGRTQKRSVNYASIAAAAAAGNLGTTDDYKVWVYRSLDGLAWYKHFELTLGVGHSDNTLMRSFGSLQYLHKFED